jgi:EmrB/QacA subfamily drug resistance transporter
MSRASPEPTPAPTGTAAGTTPTATGGDAPLEGPLLRLILIVTFGPLLLNLSSTTINVALDKLMIDLNAPLSVVQWIVTGYLLALTLVLPSFRWAVERVGSRRLYVGCLLGFTITSTLSALAWSAPSLIVFRLLQGAVGGLLAPLTQTLIAQLAGAKRMGRAVSIISIPFLVAPLFGPVLGGLLIQRLSWRWLFLFNTPLGLVGAWLAHRKLPLGKTASRTRLDLVGLALLSPGIAAFTYGLSALGRTHGIPAPRAYLPLAAAIVLVAIFVLDARRRPRTALIDLNVFRHRAVGASLAIYLLTSFGSFGAQLILPLYYQQVRGASPIHAGLLLAPQGLGMLLTLPQVGKLTDRLDHGKLVVLGVLTTLLGTLAFTQVTDHTPYLLLAAALVLRGAGLGATNTPALAAAYRDLEPDEIPNATAALNIVQRLGAPLGTATMAVALQRFAPVGGATTAAARPLLARAFAHTFTLSAALSALALFAAFALIRTNQATRSHP